MIEQNKVVSVSYELRVDNEQGEVIQTVDSSSPLDFIFGMGYLLPAFESQIAGLNVGDSFAFSIACDDAYGQASDEAVVDVPKSVFLVDGKIDETVVREGNALPMMDSDGNHMNGVIVEVKDDVVVMDFNHPLAGDDLYFTGKVEAIRDATAEELEKGLQQAGCSCNCDSCEGNCEGDCEKENCECGK